MRLNISRARLRARLPIVIADDLRLIAAAGPGGLQLTPAEATALGCRLIRQATIVDPTLAKRKTAAKKVRGR